MKQWQEIIKSSPRQYSLYCKNLTTGKILNRQANDVVEAASTIKVPILLCLLEQAQKQKISLQKQIKVLRRQIGENGSGILKYFDLSQPFLLYNLAWLMIIESDNAATNVIVELLGKDVINDYCHRIGASNTHLELSVLNFPDDYSLDREKCALTTAADMAEIIRKLFAGELLDSDFTKIALNIMNGTKTDFFCRRLPFERIKKWGNKTGSIALLNNPLMVLNDCGYIITKDQTAYIYAMFVNGPGDKHFAFTVDSETKVEFAEVAAALFRDLETK